PVAGRGANHKTHPGGQEAKKRQPGTAAHPAGKDRDRPVARQDNHMSAKQHSVETVMPTPCDGQSE
ncbi:hypothetical protein, partial [Dactylosporangium sp. NPDC005555]|uniref:hypothetical protein n=1 Tax=Dactylosporangium sp. NPDC005555 TaxID=3154889 RepID=UPI0033B83961